VGIAFALTIPVAATAWAELDAGLQPGKRYELEEQRTEALRRDDDEDGAPPGTRVDLDHGRAVVRR
jgi:hypothetical protein